MIVQDETITISWHVSDIFSRDASLTIEQSREVLTLLKKTHDATIGVNWDTIDAAIDVIKDRSI